MTISTGIAVRPMIYFEAFPSEAPPTLDTPETTEALYAIDATTGTQVWRSILPPGQRSQAPVVVGGVAFVTSFVGNLPASEGSVESTGTPTVRDVTSYLYAYDAQTGQLLWQKDMASAVYDGLYSTGDLLIIPQFTFTFGTTPTITKTLVALRPSDGSQVWHAALSGAYGSFSVSVALNHIYTSAMNARGAGISSSATFSAYDASNGSLLWNHQEPTYVGNLIATSTAVYASTTNETASVNGIVALHPDTGARLWQRALGATDALRAANQAMAFVDQPSSITSTPARLLALDARDGSQIWQTSFPVPVNPAFLAASANVVYCSAFPFYINSSSGSNSLFALDAATGTQLWNVQMDALTDVTSLALGAGSIFAVEHSMPSNLLVARRTSDGSELWSFPMFGAAEVGTIVD